MAIKQRIEIEWRGQCLGASFEISPESVKVYLATVDYDNPSPLGRYTRVAEETLSWPQVEEILSRSNGAEIELEHIAVELAERTV